MKTDHELTPEDLPYQGDTIAFMGRASQLSFHPDLAADTLESRIEFIEMKTTQVTCSAHQLGVVKAKLRPEKTTGIGNRDARPAEKKPADEQAEAEPTPGDLGTCVPEAMNRRWHQAVVPQPARSRSVRH